ncbi:glycosyltransferase [Candidatus Woesearchaeota archaeon]|nr:glycosyltransferase [Candidatus Woesearchaeota archaeon]
MNVLYNAVVYLVWFFSTFFVVLISLVMVFNRNKLYEKKKPLDSFPLVSVIVPAYNEEHKIAETIASLKDVTYPNIEFIVVNDGSRDGTSAVVTNSIGTDPRFRFIDRKVNKGKAASLNEGISIAKGAYVACMDADSSVEPDIFHKTLPYFDRETIGAVTVSVELKNPKSILHKIIDIEYIIGLSLFLKLFSVYDCIFVTPGPFSVYRKTMLDEIGGFDITNITEDHEIAYRIHKAGYAIVNCFEAKVYTICPETFKGIYVQRRRWYSGAIHTLLQHRDVLFNNKLGVFGYFAPYNYLLVSTGLGLFYASTYLAISRTIENLWYYSYTNFNFFDHLLEFQFDILQYGRIYLIGLCAFLFTLFLMVAGLRLTGKQFASKKVGMLGFPYMFFLYQIFWSGALYAVLRRKHVRWR